MKVEIREHEGLYCLFADGRSITGWDTLESCERKRRELIEGCAAGQKSAREGFAEPEQVEQGECLACQL